MELLIRTIMTSDTASKVMQIRKMADYNLLLVAIPEDTRKSEPMNQKK